MNPEATKPFHLVPEQGIEIIEGQTVASACPVWLRIEPIAELARQKWIRLRYSSSFFDEPVRPLIRFVTRTDEPIILPMNGPVFGSAEWVGRVPDGTVSAAISPVRRRGPFAFRLDGLMPARWTALVMKSSRHDPGRLFWAARSHLVNSRREAWQSLSFAAGGTPMSAYAKWHERFVRPIDLNGLDRPRSDWSTGPVFHLILTLEQSDPDRLRETIQSLRAQIYPHWFLHAVVSSTTSPSLLSAFHEQAGLDMRFSEMALHTPQPDFLKRMSDRNEFVALIDAGDCLPDFALAVVAEELAREPEFEIIYSDEDTATPEGSVRLPVFKPDWSPVRQKYLGYVGRLTLFRARSLTANRLRQLLVDEKSAIDELTKHSPRSTIKHIRRALYHRHAPISRVTLQKSVQVNRAPDDPPQWPEVTVVIPTRDRADLISECLRGLREKTDYPWFGTVVVDNGSTAPDAVRLLAQIAAEPRTTVLYRPGPFNYSAMCNDGARTTKSAILLFLNNDIAMIEPGWLKAMVRWAIEPNVGVVGAKLLFPNGVMQHAGVVLGMGGIAGHVYLRSPADHRGYMAELTVPREVTAVTGACIAIERSKFEAVGGFDAENLPIDLNDIDFCLRVGEYGWANIWTPEATLIHHQSGTRGIDSDPFVLYRKERGFFVPRWSHVIRDDPYFHPAFSLYSHNVALA